MAVASAVRSCGGARADHSREREERDNDEDPPNPHN
jgi:hypothetical protein